MMKKFLVTFAVAITALTATAQTVTQDSKWSDNWYIGVNGGIGVKTTHTAMFVANNYNPTASLRLGRYFTPVFGLALDGTAYFGDKDFIPTRTFVTASNVSLLATVNLSNWFGGYKGQPRLFEVIGVVGPGWLHSYGDHISRYTWSSSAWSPKKDALTAKVGLDFAFNLGRSRAWQVYLEPALVYALEHGDDVQFNLNQSMFHLSVGFNYKFGNSNGTHNFKQVDLAAFERTIASLNDSLKVEAQKNEKKDLRIADDLKRIAALEEQLEAARKVKPDTIINRVTTVVNNNVLQPSVVFGQGKSTVDQSQMANVAMVAKYMKNHPNAMILIKGYASPEGDKELNYRLSLNRAISVRNALIGRYGISDKRLSIQAMGATDELFDELDFNRVVTFTDTTK